MEGKTCPVCGKKLKKKVIKKQKNYIRGIRSFVCEDCGYAEYDSNERKQAILEGHFDREIGIKRLND